MESARTILWLAVGALSMFLFIEWNEQNQRASFSATEETPQERPEKQYSDNAESSSSSFQSNLPSITNSESVVSTENSAERPETTTLSNNVLSITVDSKGADIVGATLLKYFPNKKDKQNNVKLMYVNNPVFEFHRLQSGLLSSNNSDSPSHIEKYSLASKKAGELKFLWVSSSGARVTKTYTLAPDSYLVGVSFTIENPSNETNTYIPYYQLVKDNVETERSMFDVESYSFDGGIIYDGDSYEKQYADDLIEEPYRRSHSSGWFANIRHHFVVAVLPGLGVEHRYEAEHDQAANLNKLTAIGKEGVS